jgi:hypothetical protein
MAMLMTVHVQIANNFRIGFFSRGNPKSLYLISDYSIDVLVIFVFWLLRQLTGRPSSYSGSRRNRFYYFLIKLSIKFNTVEHQNVTYIMTYLLKSSNDSQGQYHKGFEYKWQ